jgi:hypothetical protein
MIEEKLQNLLLDLEILKEPEIYHRDFGTWGGKLFADYQRFLVKIPCKSEALKG